VWPEDINLAVCIRAQLLLILVRVRAAAAQHALPPHSAQPDSSEPQQPQSVGITKKALELWCRVITEHIATKVKLPKTLPQIFVDRESLGDWCCGEGGARERE
jgi:hypothetical protein